MAKVQGLPAWDSDTEAECIKVLPGGSALNQGRHLHALGADVRFFGALGDDSFGDLLSRHVTAQGFPMDNVRIFKGLPSSVCLVLTGKSDRAFVSCYSTTDAYSTADIEEKVAALDGCCHLHVGGYFNLKGLQNTKFTELVRSCRAKGMTISLNTQYDASESWSGEGGHLREIMPFVDLLFVNANEAERIASALLADRGRQPSVQDLGKAYPQMTILMTRGGDGCDILRAGAATLNVPTAPAETVVDATGAGDAFIAGFLSVWLPGGCQAAGAAREQLLRAAGARGHAVAKVCIGREGACVEPVTAKDLPP